jgi:hypothetical protein
MTDFWWIGICADISSENFQKGCMLVRFMRVNKYAEMAIVSNQNLANPETEPKLKTFR